MRRTARPAGWAALLWLPAAALSGCANGPQSALSAAGYGARRVEGLWWVMFWIALGVCVEVVAVLGWALLWRRRPAARPRGGDPIGFVTALGVVVPFVILAVVYGLNVGDLAAIASPARPPRVTVDVVGHQWWWEVRYDADDPAQAFTTANEIHIPVGRPVRVKLNGADVIHSFWVPALSGKTDTIPGRTNVAWLQADRPGVYRGQCAEYCGVEHAHMALYVVADPPAAFAAWRQAQLQSASAPLTPAAIQGVAVFQARCSACHTVRGTEAGGLVGPDLTHLMSRSTIAAGTLPNSPASLSGWIANPQALKPGARMPPTYLSAGELAQVRAYLETLK